MTMTKPTYEHLIALLEFYRESSSGKEPENAAANEAAWDEVEAIKNGPALLDGIPDDITPCKLDCIVMPNGEVLSMGKVLGMVDEFRGALTTK